VESSEARLAPRRGLRGGRRAVALGALSALASLVFAASAAAQGSFVIGDGNAAVGSSVTFWGAQWWQENSLSGGLAPASFKGFADTVSSSPSCGETWTTRPGNSSKPPAGPLPELIEVVVSSNVTKSGPTISGDVHEVVVVQTTPGYADDPGHAGTGTVIATVCGGGGPLG
jgi:hypothetical protein